MLRKTFCLALLAAAAMLMTSAKVQAWGAYHVGYTHVGPDGVQHYGRTVGAGPYGAYSGGHYGAYGAYGGYRAGYGYGARYGAAYGGAYRYGYDRYGAYGGYRRW